jgi:hypothetical protein
MVEVFSTQQLAMVFLVHLGLGLVTSLVWSAFGLVEQMVTLLIVKVPELIFG